MGRAIKFFNILFGVLAAITFVLVVVRMLNPEFLAGRSEWNQLPANLAAILFLIVLLPGPLQRLGLTNKIVRMGIAWRRTLGIAMYFFALAHFLFLIDYIPWFSGGLVKTFDVVTASGFVAALLLVPVILTSNNHSVRFLRKHWKVVQRMTYLALPLIAIHLWKTETVLLATLYSILVVIILVSFIVEAHRKQKSPLRTGFTALVVVGLSAVIAIVSLKYLFKNAEDAAKDATLEQSNERIQGLVEEKLELEQQLKDLRERKVLEGATIVPTDYQNGRYKARGNYKTKGGELSEAIDVMMTIENDVVQSVAIVGFVDNDKSDGYVKRFASDIQPIVVGRDIDELVIDAVGGASDTSAGFRTALASIKAQARNPEKPQQ